ncbi:MAG TPA: FAD-dependent oxidoreductase, partial [Polyangiaceae bacterium]
MQTYSLLLPGLLAGVLSFACQQEGRALDGPVATEQSTVNPPTNLADFHHDQKVKCSDCHNPSKLFPDDNESDENSGCIRCHRSGGAPPATSTAAISAHRSHLGKVGCTICHHAHTASQTYCSNCHLFDMEIPFQGTPEWTLPNLHPEVKVSDAADVVVVGSGGAGLSAAITVSDLGASVIVLEKQPLTGGNTMLSAGGMNAANTQFQRALGIDDSVQRMIDDTLLAGSGKNVPELVNLLATNSSDSVDWLTSLGVDLTDVGKLGGSSVRRSHRPSGGRAIGAHLIDVLRRNTEQRPIVVRVNSKV